jgi:hypothetical protein
MIDVQKTTDIHNLVDIVKIDEQKLVVTQANALARSAQEMTLQEKRLLLLAISQIRQNDQSFVKYRIPITAIQDYLDIETKAVYERTQEITNKLMSRVLHIDDENGNWEKFQWVSYSKYFSKKQSEIGEACIEIQLHEHLRPMLLNLRKYFGSVPLLQIAPMPSVNSIRVFEILWFTSMKLIKTQLSFWLDDFKKRLSLENKYRNFKDFRRDILVRAQKDCVEYSPLTFAWEEEKKGRKIVRLHFALQGNVKYQEPPALPDLISDNTPELAPPTPQPPPIIEPIAQPNCATTTEPLPQNNTLENHPSNYKLLEEQGISDEKIQELIAHHRVDVISHNIELIRQKYAAGKIPNGKMANWTIKAIQEDWHGQATQKTPYEKAQDTKQRAISEEKRQAAEKEKQRLDLEKRYNQEKAAAIDALLDDERFKANNLANEQAEFLRQRIEGTPALYNLYRKNGFETPAIKKPFRHFVASIYLPAYKDFGTWCAVNNIDLEKLA